MCAVPAVSVAWNVFHDGVDEIVVVRVPGGPTGPGGFPTVVAHLDDRTPALPVVGLVPHRCRWGHVETSAQWAECGQPVD